MRFDPQTGEFIPDGGPPPPRKKSKRRQVQPPASGKPDLRRPGRCGECQANIHYGDRFCRECGVELVWGQSDTREPEAPRYGPIRGALDRMMNIVAIPLCLFAFPFLGWTLLTNSPDGGELLLGLFLTISSVGFWIMIIFNGVEKLLKRGKKGS